MRGGKRPGAGRPLLAEEKRKTLNCRVATTTYNRIREEAQKNAISVGQMVDRIVEHYNSIM